MLEVIRTNHLTKVIDKHELVSDINIHAKKGQIYGLLGPAGAGKTAVMKLITNLWKPTSGDVELFEKKLTSTSYDVFKRIGSVIDFPLFYEQLSGRQNLALHAEYMGYYNEERIVYSLEILDLLAAQHQPVEQYSWAMKRKLSIARAILTKPELLILDEPTVGLDGSDRIQLYQLLKQLVQSYGMTVMISDSVVSEIEPYVHAVGIINEGKLLKQSLAKELQEQKRSYIEVTAVDVKYTCYILAERLGIYQFKVIGEREIRIYDQVVLAPQLLKDFIEYEVNIESFTKHTETLEDYFNKLTGRG